MSATKPFAFEIMYARRQPPGANTIAVFAGVPTPIEVQQRTCTTVVEGSGHPTHPAAGHSGRVASLINSPHRARWG